MEGNLPFAAKGVHFQGIAIELSIESLQVCLDPTVPSLKSSISKNFRKRANPPISPVVMHKLIHKLLKWSFSGAN